VKVYISAVNGGRWVPVHTDASTKELLMAVMLRPSETGDDGIKTMAGLFGLPRFHAILLPNSQRWDASNRRWTQDVINGAPTYRSQEPSS
jgi:hypothetical protein